MHLSLIKKKIMRLYWIFVCLFLPFLLLGKNQRLTFTVTDLYGFPPFEEKFSIIYPTHKKRMENLHEILENMAYGQSKYLDTIFIYWIDKNSSIPPPKISDYVNVSKLKVKMEIINSEKRHLTDRFIRPKNLTTRTVFSCDDDIKMPPSMLDSLFEMYLSNNFRNFLVGTTPRTCLEGRYQFKKKYYNMVLTDACFLDVSMLDLFQMPKYTDGRDWVNERFNGEDILMNYIVQDYYKTPPIAIKFHKGNSNSALSSRPGHYKQRTQACAFFNKEFGREVTREFGRKNVYRKIVNSIVDLDNTPDFY